MARNFERGETVPLPGLAFGVADVCGSSGKALLENFGGDPKRWLVEWFRAKGIQDQERVAHEMRCLIKAVYTAGIYDQLNLSSLASVEILARRIQAVVDAYARGVAACRIGVQPEWSHLTGVPIMQSRLLCEPGLHIRVRRIRSRPSPCQSTRSAQGFVGCR